MGSGQVARVLIHHTPTHASWLNQIELFFSILGRRLLRRGEFASIDGRSTDAHGLIRQGRRRPFLL